MNDLIKDTFTLTPRPPLVICLTEVPNVYCHVSGSKYFIFTYTAALISNGPDSVFCLRE